MLGWQILPSRLGVRPGRGLVAAVVVVADQIHGTAVAAVQVVAPIQNKKLQSYTKAHKY